MNAHAQQDRKIFELEKLGIPACNKLKRKTTAGPRKVQVTSCANHIHYIIDSILQGINIILQKWMLKKANRLSAFDELKITSVYTIDLSHSAAMFSLRRIKSLPRREFSARGSQWG